MSLSSGCISTLWALTFALVHLIATSNSEDKISKYAQSAGQVLWSDFVFLGSSSKARLNGKFYLSTWSSAPRNVWTSGKACLKGIIHWLMMLTSQSVSLLFLRRPQFLRKTTNGHQRRLRTRKTCIWKCYEAGTAGEAKCGPTTRKQLIFKSRGGLFRADNPLIRMALLLLSVSLANTDEHRTNAWMGSDMDWICLLFAGPKETLFPITTFLSILCNHTVLAHTENVELLHLKKKRNTAVIE